MSDEIVERYLKHLIGKGLIKFGWNDDIAEYQYIRFVESRMSQGFDHPNRGDCVMIECQYMDGGRIFSKSFEVERKDILQFVRDNKLTELGI
jgi:hypothetical protein